MPSKYGFPTDEDRRKARELEAAREAAETSRMRSSATAEISRVDAVVQDVLRDYARAICNKTDAYVEKSTSNDYNQLAVWRVRCSIGFGPATVTLERGQVRVRGEFHSALYLWVHEFEERILKAIASVLGGELVWEKRPFATCKLLVKIESF